MRTVVICGIAFAFAIAVMAASLGNPSKQSDAKLNAGRMLLEAQCGRCHAVAKAGKSSLAGAPPLRDVYRAYPIERLEFELSEGIGSRHKNMPQIQFSSEQIDQIISYLESILEKY